MKRLTLHIFGEVQGVGFRWQTERRANTLGLAGWVRNLPNGSVEITAEGEENKLRELADWVRNGPRWALVERVEERWEELAEGQSEFIGFQILF